jgi:hypothetical protein
MKNVDVELIVRAAARIERLAKIHHGSMAFRPENQGRTIKASAPPPPIAADSPDSSN